MVTMEVEAYLSGRLDEQIAYYEHAASQAKRLHIWLQSSIIVLSVTVPFVVNRPTGWAGSYQFLVTAGALLLPALTGLASFRKFGETWLSYRVTGELLKNERFLFLTGSGKYGDNPHPFRLLVETVESLLSAEHDKFRSFFTEARQAAAAGAAGAPRAGGPRSGAHAAPHPPA